MTLFPSHKADHIKVQRTLHMLPQVLHNMFTNTNYKYLVYQDNIQLVVEFNELQQQEQSYLDSVLNLSNCTEIGASRKQRKEDNGTKVMIGAHTAVLALTHVSPTTEGTTSDVSMILETNNANVNLLPCRNTIRPPGNATNNTIPFTQAISRSKHPEKQENKIIRLKEDNQQNNAIIEKMQQRMTALQ